MPTVRVLAILAVLTLGACQPTGDRRCNDPHMWDALATIQTAGVTVDCAPGFSNWSEREHRYVTAWTTGNTVYVWPDAMRSPHELHKVLLHEAGHIRWRTAGITEQAWRETRGISGSDAWIREDFAEVYSWCRAPHDLIGYRFAAFPDRHECSLATGG